MMQPDEQRHWEEYRESELAFFTPKIEALGFSLDAIQPHISGERFLMQAITTASGRKLILLGTRTSDMKRVVLKATTDPGGIREIEHERTCRSRLEAIRFAYQVFLTPEELQYVRGAGYAISIQSFIEQEQSFLSRPIESQFAYALRAFKAQEGAHAATYEHIQLIKRTFSSLSVTEYLAQFVDFQKNSSERTIDQNLIALLGRASAFLHDEAHTIDQYDGFLTHTDFVPHNFRICGDDIYLLDHSSLRFGNKYEGWARFVNFMSLYNPALEAALVQYVRDNRTVEESVALRLMRAYRLGEIIWYYIRAAERSSGALQELNTARVAFWSEALTALLDGKQLDPTIITNYARVRDTLRSPEEKERQVGLH